jgi:hypothetical protein
VYGQKYNSIFLLFDDLCYLRAISGINVSLGLDL